MTAKWLVGLLLEPAMMFQKVTGSLFLADPVLPSELTGTDTCPEAAAAPWPGPKLSLTGVDTDHWAPGVWASLVRSAGVNSGAYSRGTDVQSPLSGEGARTLGPRDVVCCSHGNGKWPHCLEGAGKQALGRSSYGILFGCSE